MHFHISLKEKIPPEQNNKNMSEKIKQKFDIFIEQVFLTPKKVIDFIAEISVSIYYISSSFL